VVWLTSWYPGKVNFLDGDFIERHAECASQYDNIFVIHVVKSPLLKGNKIETEERTYSPSLSAVICYYPSFRRYGKFVDVLISNLLFGWLHFKTFRQYKKRLGKPDGILVQVGLKAGIMAVLYKILYKTRYILFERWTGFLAEAKPNFRELPAAGKWLWKIILRRSEKLVTVSDYFGAEINRLHEKKEYEVIPNVIRSSLFFPVNRKERSDFRFIHVSNMDYQKNFEDVLRAFHILVQKNRAVSLEVYGPVHDSVLKLTDSLSLGGIVVYRGEVTHDRIALAMQEAEALILYSRYETFGNVIIEANACGLPVIVSDHPVFREIVEEGITGIFVKGELPGLLAEKMEWLIANYSHFNPGRISSWVAEKYNAERIGKLFNQLFERTFKKNTF
jgi:glycosyltransferase involved in cell wall biosynthesis